MPRDLVIRLPWPPSLNRCWRNVKGRMLLSREGRKYRKVVGMLIPSQLGDNFVQLSGRLKVFIRAVPPDRRRRDLDNLLKAPLDALQCAGVFADDEQIDDLRIVRDRPKKPGYLSVGIWTTS